MYVQAQARFYIRATRERARLHMGVVAPLYGPAGIDRNGTGMLTQRGRLSA